MEVLNLLIFLILYFVHRKTPLMYQKFQNLIQDFFPKRFIDWETPLRKKSDRWNNAFSGPNPDAEASCGGGGLFSFWKKNLGVYLHMGVFLKAEKHFCSFLYLAKYILNIERNLFITFFSIMMVVNIKFISLKFKDYSFFKNIHKYIFLLISLFLLL